MLESPPDVTTTLALDVLDELSSAHTPASPTHPIRATLDAGAYRVAVDEGRLALDRDVVVTWRVARDAVGAAIEVARSDDARTDGDAFALLTLVRREPWSRARRATWWCCSTRVAR